MQSDLQMDGAAAVSAVPGNSGNATGLTPLYGAKRKATSQLKAYA